MTQMKHTWLASRAVARAVNAFVHSLVLAETDRIWRIDIGTPDFCALDKTVSSANISPLSQGNLTEKNNTNTNYSQISVIRTSIIRNYWVIRRRWTVPIFSLLSIAIKLPIIRISIIRKIQFYEVIRRSRLKKMQLNYPSRFEVQMSRTVIMISLFGRVRLTHLSDLEKKVETGN